MPSLASAKNLATQLVRYVKRRGVEYADVRYEHLLHESIVAENGKVSSISLSESAGIGIRVLLKGSWGFAATPHLNLASLRRTATQAMTLATACARLNKRPRPLSAVEPVTARSTSPYEIDPFTVPLSKKLDYLLAANHGLLGPAAIRQATTHMDFYKRRKLFFSTEGASIDQQIIESGAGLLVVAQRGNDAQTRSFPNSHHGTLAQAGYEYVQGLELIRGAKQTQREALALLRAKTPRAGTTTIVLDPSQVVMQLHESCGHPVELDRALGEELSYAGGSFLTPDRLGHLQYGSPHVTIVADATIPGGVGTMAFDDEGVKGQRTDIIRNGRFVGYLSSRESAPRISRASSGAMRADGWAVPPLIRMTNVNLEPGEASLEELMHDIKHGYLLTTNRSWSIDDTRLNFQFSTEVGREIVNGRLGALIKNPLYTGITPEFWGRCTGVGRREDWHLWGIPYCGKGEPVQLMHVGHGASFARFDGVTIASAQ